MLLVKDVLNVLTYISKGRCIKSYKDFTYNKNYDVVGKKSGIPQKALTEMPALIYGNPMMKVKKIAVVMTLTESAIELAALTNVNVIIAHHPIAEESNSGGITLKNYLELYNIAVFELHESFHGLHPGIPWLHGYNIVTSFLNYRGITGNIAYVGRVFDEIKTLGDIIKRLETFMYRENEHSALQRNNENNQFIDKYYVSSEIGAKILNGNMDSPVKNILHIFPHTGFNEEDLEKILDDFSDIDTILVSISHVYEGNSILEKSRKLGLNFICGNSHTMEIYENGLPLSYALKKYIPQAEVVIFRESMTSIPLKCVSTNGMKQYGEYIANKYL